MKLHGFEYAKQFETSNSQSQFYLIHCMNLPFFCGIINGVDAADAAISVSQTPQMH